MLTILTTKPEKGYELIDSGDGVKLERFGDVLMSRPDPQALWDKKLPSSEWQKAQAKFVSLDKTARWEMKDSTPKKWQIDFARLSFLIKPSAFKHVGLFPEQSENWKWIEDKIKKAKREINVLNLFVGQQDFEYAETGSVAHEYLRQLLQFPSSRKHCRQILACMKSCHIQ